MKYKLFVLLFLCVINLYGQNKLRVGVLAYGTVNWELDVLKHNNLDKKYDFVAIVPLQAENSLAKLHQFKKILVGGAKVSDKIMIIENLLDRVQNLIIGGGMTYTFIKAQGGEIGNSLCEVDKLDLALEILNKAKAKGVNVYIPTDAVNADKFAADAETCISKTNETPAGWMGLDIADETIATFSDVIANSKTVLWNGPMGVFEMEKFAKGTTAIAHAVATATANGAFSLIGGGDSVAAINKNNLADKVSYVSTGGGAMLEYMEGKVLPGIEAVRGF